MILVREINQFAASGNIEELDFDTLTMDQVSGDTADKAKLGGFAGSISKPFEVHPSSDPSIGEVWISEAHNGKCQIYKANYDTSD